MTTTPLYELAHMRDVIDAWLEEHEGELTPELAELMDMLDGDVNEKVERIGLYVQELVANAKAIRSEADRLFARAATNENRAGWLKDYLKANLARLGKTKVEGLLCTVAVQRNSQPSVVTTVEHDVLYELDETARPFIRREELVKFSIDRDAVLTAWKANQPLPAAFVVELGNHVRVR